MSSTRHLSTDTLADLQEGLLDPAASAEATTHLADCERCRADRQALDDVRSRLAAAPDAPPLPPEVARRLDDALTHDVGPVAERPLVAAPTVTPLHPEPSGRARGSNRVLQAAAAVVLLLAAGAVGVGALTDRAGDGSKAVSGAAGGDSAGNAETGAGPAAGETTFRVLATGTDYGPQSVAAAVPGLLGGRGGTEVSLDRAAGAQEQDRSVLPARSVLPIRDLPGCLGELAQGQPATPLAADVATFAGRDAVVILLPTGDDPSAVDVWVVTPKCSAQDATLLHFARVARP